MDKNPTIDIGEIPKLALPLITGDNETNSDENIEFAKNSPLFAGASSSTRKQLGPQQPHTFKVRIDESGRSENSSHLGVKRTLAHRHKTEPSLQVKVDNHDNVRNAVSAFSVNRFGKMRKLTNFLGITKKDEDEDGDNDEESAPKLFVEQLLQRVRPGSPKKNPGKRKKAPPGGVANPSAAANQQLEPTLAPPDHLDVSDSKIDSKLKQSIKLWRMMKASENMMKLDTIAMDSEHQGIIDEITRRGQTEIPIPMQLEIKQEALTIVSKTRQLYKGILRDKNQLTKDAIKRERELRLNLYGEEN